MCYGGSRAEQEGVDGGDGQADDVALVVDPFDAAVVDFEAAAFEVEERVFVFDLGECVAGDFDDKSVDVVFGVLCHGCGVLYDFAVMFHVCGGGSGLGCFILFIGMSKSKMAIPHVFYGGWPVCLSLCCLFHDFCDHSFPVEFVGSKLYRDVVDGDWFSRVVFAFNDSEVFCFLFFRCEHLGFVVGLFLGVEDSPVDEFCGDTVFSAE